MSKEPSPWAGKDRIVGLVWFFLGIAILLASISSLRLGSASEPGPGLFPFLSGLSLAAFSFIVLVDRRPARGPRARPAADVQPALQWKKVVYTIGALLGYALLLEKAGFLLTTWVLFVFLLRCIEPQGWKSVIAVSVLSSFVSYLFFDRILHVQLPGGLLWFL